MLVNMYPTEWDLPKQDQDELMILLGMSAVEWEKRAREGRQRVAGAQQARLRRIVSSAGGSGQGRPRQLYLGRLLAALR